MDRVFGSDCLGGAADKCPYLPVPRAYSLFCRRHGGLGEPRSCAGARATSAVLYEFKWFPCLRYSSCLPSMSHRAVLLHLRIAHASRQSGSFALGGNRANQRSARGRHRRQSQQCKRLRVQEVCDVLHLTAFLYCRMSCPNEGSVGEARVGSFAMHHPARFGKSIFFMEPIQTMKCANECIPTHRLEGPGVSIEGRTLRN